MQKKLINAANGLAQATNKLALPIIHAGIITTIAYMGQVVLAIIVVMAFELYRESKHDKGWQRIILVSPRFLVGIGLTVIAGLLRDGVLAVALALGYVWWLRWFDEAKVVSGGYAVAFRIAAVSQFVILEAIFLAATMWQWPIVVVLALVWASSFLVANRLLMLYDDRSRLVLASTWALVASEISWVFMVWVVSYVIKVPWSEIGLIFPQAAIVLTAIGYCFGGIYLTHAAGRLNKARLLEYLMIGLVIMVMVIMGTKWNGVI